MCRRKSGWTGFAITCFPCTATTLQKSSTRRSRSCCPTWGTPRWYMAGTAATSTSECPCWTSRRDLLSTQIGTGVCILRTPSAGPEPTKHGWVFPRGVGGWVTALLSLVRLDLGHNPRGLWSRSHGDRPSCTVPSVHIL
ncbi:small integral membrane protein 29 isoform X3 [Peromyscus leucopus]|uniref:small integral membrane protein 29 isoform X3 n=1 Tax=Peromyscus leucopus TaxID=10041 RepID=UPI0018856F7F|nr:small integral membrane protein 29 isoform X3 [Peromyscus leucopus]